MTDVSKSVIEKIKQDKVKPISRDIFLLKRSVVWTLFGISILFGGIACGIVIFQLRHAEWDIYQYFDHGLTEFLLLVFPYFWLIFLVGFIVVALYYYRRTERGYYYSTIWIVSLSIVLSIAMGGILYATGLAERLEIVFQESVPFYRGMEGCRYKIWMNPDDGLLAGQISEVITQETMELKDMDGNDWTIDVGNTLWRGRTRLSEGLDIKLIGKIKGERSFVAEEIRPWQGYGGSGQGYGQRHRRMGRGKMRFSR
jgi:hypothetical protein